MEETYRWHKVADGDLPKKSGFYLCMTDIKAYGIAVFEEGDKELDLFCAVCGTEESKVEYWIEIPPLKLKK